MWFSKAQGRVKEPLEKPGNQLYLFHSEVSLFGMIVKTVNENFFKIIKEKNLSWYYEPADIKK